MSTSEAPMHEAPDAGTKARERTSSTSSDGNYGRGAVLGVLAISFTNGLAINLVLASVETVQAQFPEQSTTSIMQMVTLPNLLIVPLTLLIGVVAGKRVGFRPVALTGFVLLLVGGLLPLVIAGQWWVVMVGTVLRGIGGGLISSLPLMMTVLMWRGAKRQAYLGYELAATALGGVTGQLLGGALPALGISPWMGAFSFLIFLAIVAACLPEPPPAPDPLSISDPLSTSEPQSVTGPTSTTPVRERFSWAAVAVFALMIPTTVMVALPALSMSTLVEGEGLSNSAGTASVLVSFTIVSFAFGILFGKATRKFGWRWASLSFTAIGVGLTIVAMAPSMPVLMVGMALAGLGMPGATVSLSSAMALMAPRHLLALSMAIALAMSNIGLFGVPFTISGIQSIVGSDSMRPPIAVAAGFFLIGAVLLVLWNPVRGKDFGRATQQLFANATSDGDSTATPVADRA